MIYSARPNERHLSLCCCNVIDLSCLPRIIALYVILSPVLSCVIFKAVIVHANTKPRITGHRAANSLVICYGHGEDVHREMRQGPEGGGRRRSTAGAAPQEHLRTQTSTLSLVNSLCDFFDSSMVFKRSLRLVLNRP